MATAKYWRLLITENNGDTNYVTVAEMEMFGTIGGADVCSPDWHLRHGVTLCRRVYVVGADLPGGVFSPFGVTCQR